MNIFSKIDHFTQKNPDEFLAFGFAFLGEMLMKSAEKNVFRPQDISSVHYNVLCTLAIHSPRPASDISKFILGSSANFSAILGRMEKLGLITREISKIDRREIFVFLTEKGRKKFEETRKKFQEYFIFFFQNLPDDAKKNAKKMLLEMEEFLQ